MQAHALDTKHNARLKSLYEKVTHVCPKQAEGDQTWSPQNNGGWQACLGKQRGTNKLFRTPRHQIQEVLKLLVLYGQNA